MERFTRTLRAGWSDIDLNMHMRNTAYLDKAVDVRMMYFAHCGLPITELMQRRIGPVVKSDEVEYFREVLLLEEVHVTLELAGSAEDGSRFRLRSDILKLDGQRAARVASTGGWLDLGTRKLIAPPADVFAVMSRLTRTSDFEVLPSSRK
jgi:acyl-CoA thioester hydrolase